MFDLYLISSVLFFVLSLFVHFWLLLVPHVFSAALFLVLSFIFNVIRNFFLLIVEFPGFCGCVSVPLLQFFQDLLFE
jgi:hypothetical protein